MQMDRPQLSSSCSDIPFIQMRLCLKPRVANHVAPFPAQSHSLESVIGSRLIQEFENILDGDFMISLLDRPPQLTKYGPPLSRRPVTLVAM